MEKYSLERLVFGDALFGENEEHLEFQYKLLCIVLIAGGLFTGLFLLGEFSKLNPLSGSLHLYSMSVFTGAAMVLWWVLRGHQHRFPAVAWTYLSLCMLEYFSALLYVPQDELRVLWFFTNISGVYILLGQRIGALSTLASIALLILINPYLSAPYSVNAMATLIVAMIYQGTFFYLYGKRSISYLVRMQESHRQLHYQATHDTLTEVLNARAYYAACDYMIHLAQRNHTPFAVLFVDLDHFKAVNDTYGHAVGDAVLKSVASTLKNSLRASDALGRIGGEEFSIFLPNTPMAGALQLAESIRQRIEASMPLTDAGKIPITASIGASESRAGQESMQHIQKLADQAMYEAKTAGRNRVSTLNTLTDGQPEPQVSA